MTYQVSFLGRLMVYFIVSTVIILAFLFVKQGLSLKQDDLLMILIFTTLNAIYALLMALYRRWGVASVYSIGVSMVFHMLAGIIGTLIFSVVDVVNGIEDELSYTYLLLVTLLFVGLIIGVTTGVVVYILDKLYFGYYKKDTK